MLDRINKHKVTVITIFLITVLIVDVFGAISTIYMNVRLDTFTLPEFVLYGKILIELILIAVLIRWTQNSRFKLTKEFVMYAFIFIIFLLSVQAITMYLYKYTKLLESLDIVENKILLGNPDLVFDYSRQNYALLKYLTGVYQGITSEIVNFFELMIMMILMNSAKNLVVEKNEFVEYDAFMYKRLRPLYYIGLSVLIFVSLSLFSLTYEHSYQGIGVIIGFIAFYLSVISAVLSFKINQMQYGTATKALFVAYHRQLKIYGIISAVLVLMMLYFTFVDMQLGASSFRVIVLIGALGALGYLIYDVYHTLSYENK